MEKRSNVPIYVIIALMLAILLGTGVFLGQRVLQYRQGAAVYEEAVEVVPVESEGLDASDPHDACLMQLRSLDLASVLEASGDAAGWILIPGTKISYPIVQGADNEYYLNHTYNGKNNMVGAIFADARNRLGLGAAFDVAGMSSSQLLTCVQRGQITGLPDFNTIIYGHRMRDGSMFASLKHYRDQQYYEEHPYVGMVLVHRAAPETDGSSAAGQVLDTQAPDGAYVEQRGDLIYTYYVMPVFSAFTADTTSDEAAAATYVINPGSEEAQQQSIALWQQQSVIRTDVTPAQQSRVVTLSTCSGTGTYSTRWVVKCCTMPVE